MTKGKQRDHPKIVRNLHSRAQAEINRRRRVGEIRPVIHADFNGSKFVAVGCELLHSSEWRTFHDFLSDYVKHVLTPEWGKAEIRKPFEQRNEIMKWYDGMCRYQQSLPLGQNGLYGAVPNGPMRAYICLGYDLYTLQHHRALQGAVIERLKQKEQFQGARHELLAAATCIRAGYDIEYEDETDKSRKHPEFIATHRGSGQKIAVEAKSRHRSGILGFEGEMQPNEMPRAGIERLLRNALKKPASPPYVVFFDLNLPPSDGHVFHSPWTKEVLESVTKIGDSSAIGDPFNLIVFSNQPDHYMDADVPSSGGSIFSVLGRNPRIRAEHPEVLIAVHEAAQMFGVIPDWFEDS